MSESKHKTEADHYFEGQQDEKDLINFLIGMIAGVVGMIIIIAAFVFFS